MKGNKGEWSEAYTLLRLLADGKLFAADEQLNRVEDMFFPILKIIREETKGNLYEYCPNPVTTEIEINLNENHVLHLPANDFDKEAKRLFSDIVRHGSGDGAFEIANTESFIQSIYVNKLKAPAPDKSDIKMQIHDINTGHNSLVGFSIKSELGSPPTLLNASGATNFIYKIDGLNSEYNSSSKGKALVKEIYTAGGHLVFQRMESSVFNDNLQMIDSLMPAIVAEMLIGYYSGKEVSCIGLAEYVGQINPLSKNTDFYKHKIKELLSASALGMKPATRWNGTEEASGGYIIVKTNGDVVAYHLHNRDAFRGYLLNNTRFETASTERNDFCKIYKENGSLFIKLNLQIRFSS